MIKFSIITPTLNRPSLKRCCESIDNQTYNGQWQHLIGFDGVPDIPLNNTYHERRRLLTFRRTRAWGNYQRHAAFKYATGDYLLYLDCDNFLTHPDALKDIAERIELAKNPAWALFPILRHGSVFLHDPPGMCMTDTLNMIIKREYAQWPNTEAREADGMLAEQLKAEHPYMAFPDCPPIGIMEKSSNGI